MTGTTAQPDETPSTFSLRGERAEWVARLALLSICAKHGILGSDAESEVKRYLDGRPGSFGRLHAILLRHQW